ncbi:MAG TPA: CpsD/CapB family tyrosine-protein kinase [Paenibacillus sp.]|jgi:capsular exopolysaccharide synthesis family protein
MRRLADESKLIMNINRRSPIAEGYRNLRTNIQFSSWNHELRVICVASTLASEGKTTTISNLAVAYAQEGKKVILIDADLRHPSLQVVFDISNKIGLSNVLANQCPYAESVRSTTIDNLSVIPSGPIPPNPTELLANSTFNELLESLKEEYDLILIDTAPIMAVSDGLVVAAISDGVILVVMAGKTKREYILKSKEKLAHVQAQILGVVLNNKKFYKSEAEHYSYYGIQD